MERDIGLYHRLIDRLGFVLLALIPLVIYPDGSRFNVAISKFIGLMALSVIFLGLVLYFRQWRLRLDLAENRWLLAYAGLIVLSSLFALSPKLAIFGSTSRYDGVITFAGYLAAYSLGRQMRLKPGLLLGITLSGLIISGYAILQFFQLDPAFLKLYPSSWNGLAFGTMGNPNFLGSYLTLIVPLAMYFYLQRSRWYGLVMYGVIYFALLATRTRGAWIGAMAGFLIMVWLYYRQAGDKAVARRRILILIILSIVLFGLFVIATNGAIWHKILALFSDIHTVLTDPDEADTAGTNRFYVWGKTIRLIKQRPLLGVGVENMSLAMKQNFYDQIVADWGRYRNWDKAHNEYLNIALASGIPSLIAYLGFVGLVMKKGWRKLKRDPLWLPLFAAAAGYLVQATFNIQMVMVYYFFMALLGSLSAPLAPVTADQAAEGELNGGNVYSDHHGDGV